MGIEHLKQPADPPGAVGAHFVLGGGIVIMGHGGKMAPAGPTRVSRCRCGFTDFPVVPTSPMGCPQDDLIADGTSGRLVQMCVKQVKGARGLSVYIGRVRRDRTDWQQAGRLGQGVGAPCSCNSWREGYPAVFR